MSPAKRTIFSLALVCTMGLGGTALGQEGGTDADVLCEENGRYIHCGSTTTTTIKTAAPKELPKTD